MINLSNTYLNFIENIFDKIFQKTKIGILKVTFPSKKIKYFGNNSDINADLIIKNYKFLFKLLTKGSVGFAESYIEGDFETENLTSLLVFARKNESSFINLRKSKYIFKLITKMIHHYNGNTKSKSKRNISYHYDLGNKFYELWLDKTMTYSSALFEYTNDDLAKAQLNKYQKITSPIKLNENSTLLEIGCGWGGFSTYVAKNFGSKINAITNSKKQFEYTSKRIFDEGLNEKVKVKFMDYRDINEKYDNIASIEMFEAVGIKYWPLYFNKIKNTLNNEGIASLQIITIDDKRAESYQKNPDFIQRYIFPGGVLPSKKQLYDLTLNLGINLKELNSFGISYAKTLNLWNKSFQNSWQQISNQGFSNKFKRMWEYYFCYCEAGFITNTTDVSQFIIKK
tara:strand:+ start:3384 stop:4574 length:1191 start_codon:yes stop_codon:yes gene_type:complete